MPESAIKFGAYEVGFSSMSEIFQVDQPLILPHNSLQNVHLLGLRGITIRKRLDLRPSFCLEELVE